MSKKKMKRIIVTGSHGVGKTSLCEALAEHYEDVAVIPEVARRLIARGIEMNDKVSEIGIISYITEYFSLLNQIDVDLVVSDRAVFDLYAYITTKRPEEVRDEFVILAEEVVKHEMATTHAWVYVPIEFPMGYDGVRPEDIEYQKTIDKKIVNLLNTFGVTVWSVSGTLENRVSQIMEKLSA